MTQNIFPDWHAEDGTLDRFARYGTPPFPASTGEGWIDVDDARIWFAAFGTDGPVVVLLHGGLGHAGNWSFQIAPLRAAGYRVVVIDSRGHGRSSRGDEPLHYDQLATDTAAVLDTLNITQASFVGWSDGACAALALARIAPARVGKIVFFACNVRADGARPFVPTPTIDNCIARHRADYASLSATPDDFDAFMDAVSLMQSTDPDYDAADLAAIDVPVIVTQAPDDEFIRLEHAQFIAANLPQGRFVSLPFGTHFAPLQHGQAFSEFALSLLSSR